MAVGFLGSSILAAFKEFHIRNPWGENIPKKVVAIVY
jgi:hypothetical protein